MNRRVELACEAKVQTLLIAAILPTRRIPKGVQSTVKYGQIVASIRQVGIIEPLVVYRRKEDTPSYMLLDGHVRLEVLKSLAVQSVECLVATDDEAFTYNHKVSRLTAIQEHFMIMKAVKNGVTEDDIAQALNVDVAQIRKKRDMLVGICPEAVELLKGAVASATTFGQLRKVKPMRQIEMAELMCAARNFSLGYAKCLLAATPADQLVDQGEPRDVDGLSSVEMARMEREMEGLSRDFKEIEDTHGKNVLNLVIVVGYLKRLLDNARVVRYLAQAYPEILTELQKIVETRSLDGAKEG